MGDMLKHEFAQIINMAPNRVRVVQFGPKLVQNGFKTTPNGVRRVSGGIRQLTASSSSNMSQWGFMVDPFKPRFIDFQTFSEKKHRNVQIYVRTNEFLMATLAKVLSGT